MDNLPLLRDIHLPPEVWGYAPGYGWLVVAFVLGFSVLMWFVIKYLYRKSLKYNALRLLQTADADTVASARQISEILRRACRARYPQAVALKGRAWAEFLNQHTKTQKLAPESVSLLINAPFAPENTAFEDKAYADLRLFARHWIGENL